MTSMRPAASVRSNNSAASSQASLAQPAFCSFQPRVDFQKLLAGKTRSPVSLDEYRNYLLKHEYGAESLDFWLAVQQLGKHGRSSSTDKSPPTSPSTSTFKEEPESPWASDVFEAPLSPSTAVFDFDELPALRMSPNETIFDRNAKNSGSLFGLALGKRGAPAPCFTIDDIVLHFILPGSPAEINLDSSAREEIMHACRDGTCTRNTFLNAQQHCYDLMLLNSFPRFLASATVSQNIGRAEVHFRFACALAMALVTAALVACVLTLPGLKHDRGLRWVISFPATCAFLGVLQGWTRFCVIYGFLRLARWEDFGLCGLMNKERNTHIQEACVQNSHIHRAIIYIATCFVLGFGLAAIVYVVPVTT